MRKKLFACFLGFFLLGSLLFAANKTVTVKPAAGTYTTLAAAIAGELVANADLTVMEGILNISIESDWSGGADTAAVLVSGFTTSAAYYVNIYTDSANRAIASSWDATRYALAVDSDGDAALMVDDDYVYISGLQIENTGSSPSGNGAAFRSDGATGGDSIHLDSCRLRGGRFVVRMGESGQTDNAMYNCIVYGGTVGGILCNDGTVNLYNCTVYNNTDSGIRTLAGTETVKNCVSFKSIDDFVGDFTTIDYCASDDDDGTNNVNGNEADADWTTDFTDAANGDFTLLGGSPLVGGGTDNPGAGLYSDDIDGTERTSPWDVGAHEYISTGSIVPLLLPTDSRRRLLTRAMIWFVLVSWFCIAMRLINKL